MVATESPDVLNRRNGDGPGHESGDSVDHGSSAPSYNVANARIVAST